MEITFPFYKLRLWSKPLWLILLRVIGTQNPKGNNNYHEIIKAKTRIV